MVRKGSFAKALKPGIPLLWQQEATRRIWTVESLVEGDLGLRVIARLENDAACGQAAACRLVTACGG